MNRPRRQSKPYQSREAGGAAAFGILIERTESPFLKMAMESFRAEIGDELLDQAAEIHAAFKRHPKIKAILEPKILSGELELWQVLEVIEGAKDFGTFRRN